MAVDRTWRGGVSLALLPASLSTATIAQTSFYVPTNVPYGGNLFALAGGPSGSIFAVTAKGTYCTTDGGATWTLTAPDFCPETNAFIVDTSGTLFAGTSDGFRRSTDLGATWKRTRLDRLLVR